MTSRSEPTTTPTPPPVDPGEALAALDASIGELTPETPEGNSAEDQPKRKRGRPKGSGKGRPREPREGREPARPPEPPPPAMIDAYGTMGAGIAGVAFKIAGRFVGGRPSVWQVSEEERAELARALGPVLALHHDSIGQALPYAEPVMLIYDMFSERYAVATAQVKAVQDGTAPEDTAEVER